MNRGVQMAISQRTKIRVEIFFIGVLSGVALTLGIMHIVR